MGYEAVNIQKRVGDFLLTDISLTLEENKIYLLYGGNGAGKTTLLRVLAGELTPDSGEICYNTEKVNLVSSKDEALFPKLTGLENIKTFSTLINRSDYPLKIERWKKFRAFEKALSTKYSQCSAGMKQLLNIFCLTLNDPKLILLDEPFRALDKENKAELLEFIKELSQHTTVMLTSHQDEFLDEYPVHVIKIEEGKIVS